MELLKPTGPAVKVPDRLLFSYKDRVNIVGELVMKVFNLLKDFHKTQEENIARLRETLARDAHLRKKDFDAMMSKIITARRNKEEELEKNLAAFLKEEKAIIETLNQKSQNPQMLQNFVKLRSEIDAHQKEREKKIARAFLEFQKQEEELAFAFKKLLDKKSNLKIKDFKTTVKLLEMQNSRRKKELDELLEPLQDLREKINQDWKALKSVLEEKVFPPLF